MWRRTCTHMHTNTHTHTEECAHVCDQDGHRRGTCVNVCAWFPVRLFRASELGICGYVEQCVPDTGRTHTKQHWCPSALVWIFNNPQSICSIIHEEGHRIVSKYKHCCFLSCFRCVFAPLFGTSDRHTLSSFTFLLFILSSFLSSLSVSPSLARSFAPIVLRLWIFQMAEWFLNYPLLASALLTWFGLHFYLTHSPTRKENSDKP